MVSRFTLACCWFLFIPATLGCGDRPPERFALPARTAFIALERDFQNFRDWGSVRLNGTQAEGMTHPSGERRAYVNALPAEAGQEFPVGTMIVQQTLPNDAGRVRLFGMVKRGAGYNEGGARGWEWFELKERDDGSPGIAWRGLGPPNGEEYGGDPSGTCNSCHQRARRNDFVQALSLKL